MTETLAYGYSYESTNTNMTGFRKKSCSLDESNPSIGRVKDRAVEIEGDCLCIVVP